MNLHIFFQKRQGHIIARPPAKISLSPDNRFYNEVRRMSHLRYDIHDQFVLTYLTDGANNVVHSFFSNYQLRIESYRTHFKRILLCKSIFQSVPVCVIHSNAK